MRARWVFAVLFAWCSGVQAATRDPFTEFAADWGGLRTFLRDHGVDIRVNYVSETVTNAHGGDRELWRYADQWSFATALDLDRFFGLNQAQFKITITDRNGRNLSKDAHLGSLLEVQEIWGRGQTWRWTQFFYDQKYLGGVLDWKIGRLPGGEDFADFSCEFLNLALCGNAPGNIAVNYWYNWPVSQWATRLKASLQGLGYVEIGAFEFNPRYLQTQNGLDLGEPGGATGVLVPVEIAWQPVFAGRLRGSYKFGGWYNSSRAPDAVDNTNRQPRLLDGGEPYEHNGEYGEYVNFLQQLTTAAPGDSTRGVTAFFNATFADERTSTLDSQVALGLAYIGPFASRPADSIGTAAARTHVNRRVAAAEALFNVTARVPVPIQGSEYVAEIFYSAQVGTWLQLRPDIQYVHQPGGAAHAPDDLIVGLRLSLVL
jgi:porin